jgi:two-component system sensor histidine kinase/response regulator
MDNSGTLLIIDDNYDNLQFLGLTLRKAGYQIAVATEGAHALHMLESTRPDLILLDIMMPGMDGYEVCRAIKAHPQMADVPVIFLTAKVGPENMVKGFAVGAVDYITKPFFQAELLARVRTHLDLKRYRDRTLRYAHTMETQLLQLEQLNEEKNQYLQLATHDLKSPLLVIQMLAARLQKDPQLADALHESVTIIAETAATLRASLNKFLAVEDLERGEVLDCSETLDLGELVHNLLRTYRAFARTRTLTVMADIPPGPLLLTSDRVALVHVIENLLSNALRHAPEGSTIDLRLQGGDPMALTLENPCTQVPTSTRGQGLPIAHRLTAALGGTLEIDNHGARFRVRLLLPLARIAHV